MKTLYKKDSKGKIRVWEVYANNDELIQKSGIKDGKLITNSKLCNPKNIGKSNETNGNQQAVLEIDSLIKSKLDEGYFYTIEEAENEIVILPMLAKNYEDEKHKIDWNSSVYIQPKLDGMRCLAFVNNNNVKLMSRAGKEINTVHFINDSLSSMPDGVYDGELYAHGIGFQKNMELIKKYRPGKSELIYFYCYDIVNDDSFDLRTSKLSELSKLFGNHCKFVETHKIISEQLISNFNYSFLNSGYEGSIIRIGSGKYKSNGRSSDLLKYKLFKDVALPIIDITPNEVNHLHGTPHFELDGKRFKSGVKMSHEEREDLLFNKDQYVGKTAEIRFFELSSDGVPRFPVMVGIRLDK